MASPEAVERRRRVRALLAAAKAARDRARIVPIASVKTGLTKREQRLLKKQTAPLFDAGRIDLRFMGVGFLELYSLGWTPASGFKCSDRQFEHIWNWWTCLDAEDRVEVIRMSRLARES